MIRSLPWTDNGRLYEIQPGDATKYIVAVFPISVTGEIIMGCKGADYVLVVPIQPARKPYPFVRGHRQDPGYVLSKLDGEPYTAAFFAAIMPLITDFADDKDVLESAKLFVEG